MSMGEFSLGMAAAAGMVMGVFCCAAAALDSPCASLRDAAWGSSAEWAPGDPDGSVHCLGNGRLCVYGQGPDVIQLFGPPYSTTTIGSIRLASPGAGCASRRVSGAAVWEHRIRLEGRDAAVLTDFVDSELPCFVRIIECAEPVEFVFTPEKGLRTTDFSKMTGGAKGALLVETPIGVPSVPFGRYPIPFAFFHQFAWLGNAEMTAMEPGGAARFSFGPGRSVLLAVGGPELEPCLNAMAGALAAAPGMLLDRTLKAWAAFTEKGRDFEKELPEDTPMRARLAEVLDDVAVLIKAQQADEGGVLAGYPYHLGYVRDQYGTHRGLVALGHEEMSGEILNFYHDVFGRHGRICNAQAFGIPGLLHVHENDDVEITGYITLQAFDHLARTGDAEFTKGIFPMLEWAWTAQQHHFIGDMLPFNGDETYVAGGILPRSALDDGSAEATLLFIESGKLLIDFAEKQGLWDADRVARERRVLERVRASYRDNFWRDGRLITNNPERSRDKAALPRMRHGVCESCVTVQWTVRTENSRHVCVDCLNKPPLPAVEPKVHTLQSVALTPLYFHTTLFGKEELRTQAEEIVAAYQQTGRLPSRPDGEVSVGYDYGLLLYALTELDHPAARELFVKTLELADSTGAWAEYYRNHKPTGTRCRPWESAINVEALLHWVEKECGRK